MKSHLLLSLLLISGALADPVLSVLGNTAELSRFNSFVNSSTDFKKLLSSETNFTLLAPSNEAFEKWDNGGETDSSSAMNNSILRYHLLRGRFPTIAFGEQPQFAHSFLTDEKLSNVTAGQVVKLVAEDGNAQFVSGNSTVSTIEPPSDLICEGCLIQIINTILEIPLDIIQSISEFGLKNFVAILSVGNLVTAADSPIIQKVLEASNVTYFTPNTPEALAYFTLAAKKMTKDQISGVFGYHIVPGIAGYSSNLVDGMKLKTFQGSELQITIQNGQIYVNSAKVLTSDLLVANGVLHTIDTFLDRFNITTPPPLTSAPNDTRKVGLSKGAKAAIAIGTILGLVILAAVAIFLPLRRKRPIEEDTPRSVEGIEYVRPNESEGEQRIFHRATGNEHELYGSNNYRDGAIVVPHKTWEISVDAVELDATSQRPVR